MIIGTCRPGKCVLWIYSRSSMDPGLMGSGPSDPRTSPGTEAAAEALTRRWAFSKFCIIESRAQSCKDSLIQLSMLAYFCLRKMQWPMAFFIHWLFRESSIVFMLML